MKFTYKPFLDFLLNKGITVNRLKKLGVVPDHSCRKLAHDEPVDLKHVIALCEYFNVGIEEVVTIMPESESDDKCE